MVSDVSGTPRTPGFSGTPGTPGISGTHRPVGGDQVFRIIQERLADILEIEESRITMEASFQEDLSADSLALIELVEALEQELEDVTTGFRIEDEDLADLRTVRDAVEYVVERVG